MTSNVDTAKDIKLRDALVLSGSEAEIFEEYDKRALSKKEQDILEKADEFYNAQCAKTNE